MFDNPSPAMFKVKVPHLLIGRPLAESRIREKSECNVLAIGINGKFMPSPSPATRHS